MLGPLKGVCSHYRLLFFPHHPPPPTYAQPSQKPPGFGSLGTDHINDCCGFCAANQGSVEESAAAREFLLTLQIYVECLSPKPPAQVHPGDSSSQEEILRGPEVHGNSLQFPDGRGRWEWCCPEWSGESGLLNAFSRLTRVSQARFWGHLVLCFESVSCALILNCVMQAVIFF